jgi:hypothetical protein
MEETTEIPGKKEQQMYHMRKTERVYEKISDVQNMF